MTDSNETLTRRYRELPREEPPAALDQAILAAARRAAHRERNRWVRPISIAAVLVLGIGVSMRMLVEQPGIETATPRPSSGAEYAAPAPAQEPPRAADAAEAKAPPAPSAVGEARQLPKPQAKSQANLAAPAPKTPAPRPEPAAEPAPVGPAAGMVEPPKAVTRIGPLSPTPPSATAASVAPAPARAPSIFAAPEPPARARVSPASPATAPAAEQGPAMATAPMRLKRETPAALQGESAQASRDEREVELERIAKLRSEGRDEEADKALEAFRKRYPDYRIPDLVRERVERR